MSSSLVLFRVDATAAMGMGHLMRCRAIAEAITEQGGTVVFAMVDPLPAAQAMMAAIPAQLIALPGPANSEDDLVALRELMRVLRPRITVVDGYHLDDAYLRAVAREAPLGVLWDSAEHQDVAADLIIDASPNAPRDAYAAISAQALLLLGPKMALIRRDIRHAAAQPQQALAAREQVLISFGGSDPLNLSMALLPLLRERLPANVGLTVLAGAAYAHHQDLQDLADKLSPAVRVVVNPPSVVPLFLGAGLVVSAAGGTIGELVALGLPALSVVVAQNQVAASVDGPYPCVDGRTAAAPEHIATMAAAMWQDLPGRERLVQGLRGVVDGQGAVRVANALLTTHFRERLAS